MGVKRRIDHSLPLLLKRTLSAQLHGVGCILMAVGSYRLLANASSHGSAHVWACAAFLASGFLVFLASTVYHFLADGYECSPRVTQWLDNLDHFGIYLFIAGTYTPVLMNVVREPWRTPLMIAVWTTAVLGIAYTASKPFMPEFLKSRIFSTSLYVLMGWVFVVRANEIFGALTPHEILLLATGGMAYTVGAVIYATRRPLLFEGFFSHHELWHVLVLCGAGAHYALIRSFY